MSQKKFLKFLILYEFFLLSTHTQFFYFVRRGSCEEKMVKNNKKSKYIKQIKFTEKMVRLTEKMVSLP